MATHSPLPKGRYFALTWSIPREFGGLTSVYLHRSKMFTTRGKRPVVMLTLAPDVRPLSVKLEQVRRKRMHPLTRLRNLWHELERANDRELRRMLAGAPDGIPSAQALKRKDKPVARRRDEDGEIVQTDRFRRNGTRFSSDERDVVGTDGRIQRRITIYSRTGEALASFGSTSALHAAWLDYVIGARPAILINDSQALAPDVADYRRPHVTTAHVLHNTHLTSTPKSPLGELSKSKAAAIRRADDVDLFAVLTTHQREDLLTAHYGDDDMRVIPNSRDVAPVEAKSARLPGDGVMAVRMSYQKNVPAAVRAIHQAHALDSRVHLDLFGTGYDKDKVAALVKQLGAESAVSLKGHSSRASERFATASFSLLTSRFEGQGLVLLESMAAGCLPIAFDIRYGPRDIITHGVDGFLVPAGNIEAMARQIAEVTAMSETELAPLRAAARERAQDFSDADILPLWADALSRAIARKRSDRLPEPTVLEARVREVEEGLLLEATLADLPAGARAYGVLDLEPAPWLVREPAGAEDRRLAVVLPSDRLDLLPPGAGAFSIDLVVPGDHRRVALPSAPAGAAVETRFGTLSSVAGTLRLIRR